MSELLHRVRARVRYTAASGLATWQENPRLQARGKPRATAQGGTPGHSLRGQG